MSDVIKQERGFVQFVIGFFLGVIVFGVIAAAATFYLQTHHYCASNRFSSGTSGCIPAFEYALLRAASYGPATMLPIVTPFQLPALQIQLISAGLYGLLGGILFIWDTRRSPMEIFLLIYLIVTAVVTFLLLLLIISS